MNNKHNDIKTCTSHKYQGSISLSIVFSKGAPLYEKKGHSWSVVFMILALCLFVNPLCLKDDFY